MAVHHKHDEDSQHPEGPVKPTPMPNKYGALKPVSDRRYPFWPPGSPQHPEKLLQTVQRALIVMLPENQIPYDNGAEIPVRQLIIPKTQPLEGPGTNTNLEIGHYGSTLYDVFMAPYGNSGGSS